MSIDPKSSKHIHIHTHGICESVTAFFRTVRCGPGDGWRKKGRHECWVTFFRIRGPKQRYTPSTYFTVNTSCSRTHAQKLITSLPQSLSLSFSERRRGVLQVEVLGSQGSTEGPTSATTPVSANSNLPTT